MTDELKKWIESRPPKVRVVVERFPADVCYRIRENRGHYVIVSYSEPADGPVTVRLAHGKDSYLPGFCVFGIDPESLEPCGCGKWEQPTEDQGRFTERRIRVARERREQAQNGEGK